MSFNPHTHAGCDHSEANDLYYYNVSIHTPTQGVTIRFLLFRTILYRFNPHTHAGCDFNVCFLFFQRQSFNPHTHAGCDIVVEKNFFLFTFQSTHPRRVWRLWLVIWKQLSSFNPHTHAGCDWVVRYCLWLVICFNPHTHAGCDIKKANKGIQPSIVSIHTPTQGVT